MKFTPRVHTIVLSCILSVIFLALVSCSTLVGTVKPVDEKSDHYGVLDLSAEAPKVWKKLDASQLIPKDAQIGANKDAFTSEVTDFAFQSQKNSSIVSLNSSCRKGRGEVLDLLPFLRELFLGMTDFDEEEPKSIQIAGVPALEKTLDGRMAGERTKIRALVLSKNDCVYDLMYISRPSQFPVHESDFNRFVSSLRLR